MSDLSRFVLREDMERRGQVHLFGLPGNEHEILLSTIPH